MRPHPLPVIAALVFSIVSGPAAETLRLPVKEYRDRMKAGWIGQIAGVALGGPTEFKWKDKIIPADAVPKWQPKMINDAFGQDDLYVEMTFLRTLEEHGLNVSIGRPALILPTAVTPFGAPTTPAASTCAKASPARLQPSPIQQVPQRH